MIKTELQTQQVTVEIAIQCDDCKRIDPLDGYEAGEYLRIDFTAGYGSVFGDGNRVKADLCQHCLKTRMGGVLKVKVPATFGDAA